MYKSKYSGGGVVLKTPMEAWLSGTSQGIAFPSYEKEIFLIFVISVLKQDLPNITVSFYGGTYMFVPRKNK